MEIRNKAEGDLSVFLQNLNHSYFCRGIVLHMINNNCNSIAVNLVLVKKLMTSQALTISPPPNFPYSSAFTTVSTLPFHNQLDVILQTNSSVIITHCFVVIYSEGTYWTEPRQMMKPTASVNAKLFGNCNYSQGTSNDCVQHDISINITQNNKKKPRNRNEWEPAYNAISSSLYTSIGLVLLDGPERRMLGLG